VTVVTFSFLRWFLCSFHVLCVLETIIHNRYRFIRPRSHLTRVFCVLNHGRFRTRLSVRPTPCVNQVQYKLIARLDDAMELEFEDIKPNIFSFFAVSPLCWSKNVNEERDAGEQIRLGSMRREYCILLALAMYLEVWIGSGNGMLARDVL
jgi:hypothetical protein